MDVLLLSLGPPRERAAPRARQGKPRFRLAFASFRSSASIVDRRLSTRERANGPCSLSLVALPALRSASLPSIPGLDSEFHRSKYESGEEAKREEGGRKDCVVVGRAAAAAVAIAVAASLSLRFAAASPDPARLLRAFAASRLPHRREHSDSTRGQRSSKRQPANRAESGKWAAAARSPEVRSRLTHFDPFFLSFHLLPKKNEKKTKIISRAATSSTSTPSSVASRRSRCTRRSARWPS